MLKVAEEAHKTDTGRQRHANEDSYFARAPLFAVADGMGGAQAGEVASRIAAGAFERGRVNEDAPAEGQLEQIAQRANREIHRLAQEDSSRAGMGTTLTAAILRDDEVALSHVGDSRAYVLRDGQLKRLTKDHSLVEELRRQGRLTEEQAEEHPQRSIITRALGPEPSVNVDTMTFPARDGDVFLLCSDGLTTMVPDDEIREILANAKSLRSAVSRLIDAANRRGGRDNITAVAFSVAEAEAKEAEESATLISRTAEGAGLTRERMREAGDRLRGQGPMPAPPRRRRILGWVVAATAAIVIIGGGFLVARSIYFLGTDQDGNVAVYRGLPYQLPLGVSLYSKQYSVPVQVGTLSEERQRAVTGHDLRSKADATDLADDIKLRPTAGLPPPPAPPQQQQNKKKKKKAGANSKRKQAQKS
jgi:serine/threonine protein phosphatase PrpC